MRDEAWERWLAREFAPDDDHRTFHPGCLIIIAVCVIIWIAAILGAVQLYRRSLTPDPILPPPTVTRAGTSQTAGTSPMGGGGSVLLGRTVDGTPTVPMPEDLGRP